MSDAAESTGRMTDRPLVGLGRRAYTVAETAELLGVDPDMVRRWIRSGELAASDMSGRLNARRKTYRIEAAALEAFKEKRRVVPPQSASQGQNARHKDRIIPFIRRPISSSASGASGSASRARAS